MIYQNIPLASSDNEIGEDIHNISSSNSQDADFPLHSSTPSPGTTLVNCNDLHKQAEAFMNALKNHQTVDLDEFLKFIGDVLRTLSPEKQLLLKIQMYQLLREYQEKEKNKSRLEE